MKVVSLDHAAAHLAELVAAAAGGEEIVIAVDGRAAVKLTALEPAHGGGAGETDAEAPVEEVERAFYGD